jgi:hypothetical protein
VGSAWASATIEEFEQVSLENGTELFRVRARARVGDDPEPRPVLICGPPGAPRTYEPLSSGGDRRGLLRLAYAVPTGLVGPTATFALALPDGTRIDLPQPAPGLSRADEDRGRRLDDAARRPSEADAARASTSLPSAPAPDDDPSPGIRELEQERERLQRLVAELTEAHAAAHAERDEALRGTGAAQAQREEARREAEEAQAQRDAAVSEAEDARTQRDGALSEAEDARAERDTAVQAAREAAETAQAARADRDSVLEATAADRAEHTRLMRRLRQHEARFELLRSDAQRAEAAFGPGSSARLRRLESERAQLAGHARALGELLGLDAHAAGADRYAAGPDRSGAVHGTSERVTATRDRAVRAAHEQAERDLEQMLADGPH